MSAENRDNRCGINDAVLQQQNNCLLWQRLALQKRQNNRQKTIEPAPWTHPNQKNADARRQKQD
jgi:hypothetical protein